MILNDGDLTMSKKKKTPKPRNFVQKYMADFSKPKVEEDKRKKDTKHKAREIEPFLFA